MARSVTAWLALVVLAAWAPPADAHQPPRCRGVGDPDCGLGLVVAVDPVPSPTPPPEPAPAELESWTSGDATLPWAPAVTTGPTLVISRDFAAPGFLIGVGVRHFVRFDPNPWSRSPGLAFGTLGLAALPRGALVGNEVGLDLTSRLSWVSSDELVIETALRPALRVQAAGARISLPSVLGTILPAVGFVTLSSEDTDPHFAIAPRYEGLLLRWSFGVRYVARDSPVLLFAELEPSFALIVPTDGTRPSAMLGVGLQVGFTPMQN